MDALHHNVFRNARSLSQSREPETSVFVLIADEWNRNTRQFVTKATRPKLPGGLLLFPSLSLPASSKGRLSVPARRRTGERDEPSKPLEGRLLAVTATVADGIL
jgi:hypothetical protein